LEPKEPKEDDFTPTIGNGKINLEPTIKKGSSAVDEVTTILGRPLNSTEELIVRAEGYSDTEYKDSKGITTKGVGQTKGNIDKPFDVVVKEHTERTKKLIDGLDDFPENLRDLMISSVYRGGLSGSPKTQEFINKGEFAKASKEFLSSEDYKKAKREGSGVAGRMEDL